jgi:hypothetical protein
MAKILREEFWLKIWVRIKFLLQKIIFSHLVFLISLKGKDTLLKTKSGNLDQVNQLPQLNI